MKVKADINLERLWVCSRRLMTRSEDGLTSIVKVRLIILRGWALEKRDAHFLTGQDDSG